MTSTSPPTTPRRSRRLVWVIASIGVLLAGLAGWFFTGPKVWTDGRTGGDAIAVSADVESPRRVLWTPPHELGRSINTPDQEYEPAMSPDGTEFYFVRGKAGQLPATQPATPASQPSTPATRPATQPTPADVAVGGASDIFVSYRRNNAWTPPQPLAGVNSAYDDLGPRLTADGNFLVFYSNRPGGLGGYDLWAASRLPADADGSPRWSTPFNLGPGVNSEFDEYSPAPTPDGKRLFFSTNRTAAAKEQHQAWRATIRAATTGDFDLWMADVGGNAEVGMRNAESNQPATHSVFSDQHSAFPTQPPPQPSPGVPGEGAMHSASVGFSVSNAHEVPGVNTPYHEGASSLSPSGDFLYFASNRPGGFGKFDLYRSRITGDTFGPPENLGPSVNTADNETDPQLSQSGFHLYFSSDRPVKPTVVAGTDGTIPVGGASAGLPDPATRRATATSNTNLSYDLYESDSREVFPQRQGRSMPVLSQTTWLMLGSLLLLVPLLLLLVRMDRRKLSILQRCLLVAALIHVGLLFSFTFITTVVPGGSGFGKGVLQSLGLSDVAINLDAGPGPAGVAASDIAMAVRQQSATDLPSAVATPSGVPARQAAGNELVAKPDVPLNIPQAVAGREPLTVLVTPPGSTPMAAPKLPAASVGPVAPTMLRQALPSIAAVDLKIDAGQRMQQAENLPAVGQAQTPEAALLPPTPSAVVRPTSVAPQAVPTARPELAGESLASAVGEIKPNLPPMSVATPGIPPVQPTNASSPAGPVLSQLPGNVARVAGEEAGARSAPTPAQADRVASSVSVVPTATSVDSSLPTAGKAIGQAEASIAPGMAQAKPKVSADVRPAVEVPKLATNLAPAGPAIGSIAAPNRVIGGDAVAEAAAPAARSAERTSTDPIGSAQPAATVQPLPPQAGAQTGGSSQSLAAAPGTSTRINPNVPASIAGVSPNSLASGLLKSPEAVTLKNQQTPVQQGEPEASAGGQKLAPGLTRQDVATGALAGGADTSTITAKLLPGLASAAPSSLMTGPATRPALPDLTSANVRVAGPTSSAMNDAVRQPLPEVAVSGLKSAGAPLASNTAEPGALVAPKSVDASKVEPSPSANASSATVDAKAGLTAAPPTTVRSAAPDASMASALNAPSRPAIGVAPPAPKAELQADVTSAVTPAAAVSLQIGTSIPQLAETPKDSSVATSSPTAGRQEPKLSAVGASSAGLIAVDPAVPASVSSANRSLAPQVVVSSKPVAAVTPVPTPSLASAAIGPNLAGIDGPRIEGTTKLGAQGGGEMAVKPADTMPDPAGSPTASRAGGSAGGNGDRPVELASTVVPGVIASAGHGRSAVNVPISRPRAIEGVLPSASFSPSVSVAPPSISAPDALFQRSVEQRRPLIEKMGGTQESENAVDRGLAYLARVQTADGFWTVESAAAGKKAKKPAAEKPARHEHDMALTGLSVLAFLAADHSPTKEGPYRQTVVKAVDWLVAEQGEDGDLRGPNVTRGGGSGRSNMYDHGIATMALAEAALMTGDKRYTEAAFKAADFICRSQNKKTGGWRYIPGEAGDTSVFGWQMLALHDCEQLGYPIPPDVRSGAIRFLMLVSSGPSRMLAAYMPNEGPTPSMTAEALFCRILLGEPISDEQAAEVSEFLTRDLPKGGKGGDLYFFYYASLSLSQMQVNPRVRAAWDRWNTRCRDTLIATQALEGPAAGSWTDARWGERAGAGTVFSTALATLTLEVYYRYLPIQPGDAEKAKAAWKAEEPVKPAAKVKEPKKPKFDAN